MVDLCMGVPHLILLMLISIAMGGGAAGVITGVAVTHWPNLTRVIRAEVLQVDERSFLQKALDAMTGSFRGILEYFH